MVGDDSHYARFVCWCSLLSLLFACLFWQVQNGIVFGRGPNIRRNDNPSGFWTAIVIQLILLVVGGSLVLWHLYKEK
jgi:hypothetical protein